MPPLNLLFNVCPQNCSWIRMKLAPENIAQGFGFSEVKIIFMRTGDYVDSNYQARKSATSWKIK